MNEIVEWVGSHPDVEVMLYSTSEIKEIKDMTYQVPAPLFIVQLVDMTDGVKRIKHAFGMDQFIEDPIYCLDILYVELKRVHKQTYAIFD